jgi:hypothetical protein
MASARPEFAFSAGSLSASSASPLAGPSRFVVERSLDVPVDSLRVSLAESAGVAAGDPVQLDLGDEDGLERVFTGSVAEVRPRLGGCELFCVGRMLALVDLRVSSFYRDRSAGDVVRDLVGQAALDKGEIADGVALPRFAVERRVGAHAQLRRLADRLGYALFADRQGKIHFRGLGAAASLGSGGGLGAGLANVAASASAALDVGGGGRAGLAYGTQLLNASGGLRPSFGRTLLVGGESPMSGQGEDKSFWLTATDSDFQDSAGQGAEMLLSDPIARTKDMAGRFATGLRGDFPASHERYPADRAGPAGTRTRRHQRRFGSARSGPQRQWVHQGLAAPLRFARRLPDRSRRLGGGGRMNELLDMVRRTVREELALRRGPQLATVTALTAHASSDDSANYEADVRLKHDGLEIAQVPIAVTHVGFAAPPRVGDLVLVEFLDHDLQQALITGRFYHDQERAPLFRQDEVLFEHRLPDDTVNQLRFADDGSIFLQREVKKREDNSEFTAGVRIAPDGVIEIKAGEKITVTLDPRNEKLSIVCDGKPIEISCSTLTIDADVEIRKTLTVDGDGTIKGTGKISSVTISGTDITGGG